MRDFCAKKPLQQCCCSLDVIIQTGGLLGRISKTKERLGEARKESEIERSKKVRKTEDQYLKVRQIMERSFHAAEERQGDTLTD